MGATVSKGGGNFLDVLPPQGTLHVVMLGLDSAGKTTALYRLKFDQYLNTVPTIGFNCEKIQGTVGKAKGVQFLVWDVGGQEKLRPLWRSYTRCTDGILFVVDSVDIERMEEAKMELMRTAKCPDNHGVPLLILANKQDLPGARDPKELEKLLGLNELQYPHINNLILSSSTSSSSATTNVLHQTDHSTTTTTTHDCFITGNSGSSNNSRLGATTQHNFKSDCGLVDDCSISDATSSGTITSSVNCLLSSNINVNTELTTLTKTTSSTGLAVKQQNKQRQQQQLQQYDVNQPQQHPHLSSHCAGSVATTPNISLALTKNKQQQCQSQQHHCQQHQQQPHYYKGWHIQPACAITGEGLQEGLEVLYEMILKRRKLNKGFKKKR